MSPDAPVCPIKYDFAGLTRAAEAFLDANPQYDKTDDTPVFAVLDRALFLCEDAKGSPPFRENPLTYKPGSDESRARINAAFVGEIVWFLGEYCAKRDIDFAAAVDEASAYRADKAYVDAV